jgi:hypothetical protein
MKDITKVMAGNLCATSPLGMAMIFDETAGFVLEPHPSDKPEDDALVPPGTTAPDGSFLETTFSHDNATVTLTWGARGTTLIAALSTDKPVDLKLVCKRHWMSLPSLWWAVDSGVDGHLVKGREGYMQVSLRTEPAPTEIKAVYTGEAEMTVHIDPEKPVLIAAGHGELPEFSGIPDSLQNSREKYESTRFASDGDWGGFAQAIGDSMNFARTYSTFDKHRAHIVGRGWWIYKHADYNPDFGPYFGWDQFFNGNLAIFEDPEGAKETVRAAFAYQLPEGHIANCSHWDLPESGAKTFVTAGRSQPPVGAMSIWKMHERRPDPEFLAEVYPKLVRWSEWWKKERDGNGNGLFEWGDQGNRYAHARLETGWDDTPHFDGAEMSDSHMTADAVDLNALWSLDMLYMSKIAAELGDKVSSEEHMQEHKDMNQRINDNLWNEELGIYCSRLWEDSPDGSPAFLTRITPMNFYPLACGAADESQAKRTMEWIFNTDKFWGEWILPTLPYDDPEWEKQHYW